LGLDRFLKVGLLALLLKQGWSKAGLILQE